MSTIQKLPGHVYLYFLCQSINLMAAVISVAVAASVGSLITSNSLYATLPYGMQFLFLLVATYPAAVLMKNRGRKLGFTVGATFLAFSGVVGYLAVSLQNFSLLVLSHGLLGIFTAFANFYRFAVTDGLPVAIKSKALSLVIAGGVLAGVLGPTLSSQLKEVVGFPSFSLCYAFFTVLALINFGLIYLLPSPKKLTESSNSTSNLKSSDPAQNLGRNYQVLMAIASAALGYGLMNLMMIQSSLQMNSMLVHFDKSAIAIQWHVVAMFLPSFFSGILISRFGHLCVILAGFILFFSSFAINIYSADYQNLLLTLILLGLGWNFVYVGGSALLTVALENNPESQKLQGVGDTVIAVFAMFGAMLPSFLLSTIGWEYTNMMAMISSFIILIFILWLQVLHNQKIEIDCNVRSRQV